MKFLILGASGQIGSCLTKHLADKGHTVLKPYADLTQKSEALNDVMRSVDFVFFLAFRAGGARFLKDNQHAFHFIAENVAMMETVFSALRATGKPFLYTSSQMSNMNHSSYGTMKRLAEFYTESLGGVFVKFWNVYGIEHNPETFHAISDFCQMAKRDGEIRMRTTGQESRQFLFSEDCCEALLTIAQNYKKLKGKPLHVTSFEWVSVMELAQTIAELVGGVKIKAATAEDTVQWNARNEPDRFILDLWQPKTRLRDGLKRIMEAMP